MIFNVILLVLGSPELSNVNIDKIYGDSLVNLNFFLNQKHLLSARPLGTPVRFKRFYRISTSTEKTW